MEEAIADITISPTPPNDYDDHIDWHRLDTKAFNAACKRKNITTKAKTKLRKERRNRKNARYSREGRERARLARLRASVTTKKQNSARSPAVPQNTCGL